MLLEAFVAVEVKFLEDAHDVVLQHIQTEDLHADIVDYLIFIEL